jgi:hypothetical protein
MTDKVEVLKLRAALPPAIAARYDEIVAAFKTDRIGRRLWKKGGGGLGTARDFVSSLYGATFNKKAPTGLDAYVASFSTHADDGDFEREHGLWSQWRDYAGPDGYCIVLDTRAMGLLLAEECDVRYWAHLTLDPVRTTTGRRRSSSRSSSKPLPGRFRRSWPSCPSCGSEPRSLSPRCARKNS